MLVLSFVPPIWRNNDVNKAPGHDGLVEFNGARGCVGFSLAVLMHFVGQV